MIHIGDCRRRKAGGREDGERSPPAGHDKLSVTNMTVLIGCHAFTGTGSHWFGKTGKGWGGPDYLEKRQDKLLNKDIKTLTWHNWRVSSLQSGLGGFQCNLWCKPEINTIV